jgi:hypothetical protein
MRHRQRLERIVSVGIWFYQAVPIPGVRVVPLRVILGLIQFYWMLFGIE